ncbi:MAG: putative large multi-functional protein [Fibrobacteres bacterium]|nr:putative large multi-functional protein [Fibrobacterota bacterium]
MNWNLGLLVELAAVLALGAAMPARAQADFTPPLSGAALGQWQVQGEYYGTIAGGGALGAWLIATGNDNYTVVFLPGGLLSLPGKPYGGWVQAGWNRSTFSGSAALSGTAYSVATTSNYKAASISGSGEARVLSGTTPTGAAFTLNRVVRNSPTHNLKPDPSWGAANLWFDSATGQADLAKWATKDNTVQLSRKYLYRGVQTAASHGAGLLHIEFQGCFNPTATGQGRANSGVYLQSHYEAQVLDSFGNSGATDEFGAVYTVKAPAVNAALPPLTWHTYDIYFTPRTSGSAGDAAGAALMTIYANGVLTQDATPVTGVTTAGVGGNLLVPAPLYLQNHGNEVVFNNIWFIPNATVSSLPYAKVLSAVVGIRNEGISPLRDAKSSSFLGMAGLDGLDRLPGLGRGFDLSGREFPSDAAVPAIQPAVFTRP